MAREVRMRPTAHVKKKVKKMRKVAVDMHFKTAGG
jgi:hypothetical protein